MTDVTRPPSQKKAQDRYAEDVLEYLWSHVGELEESGSVTVDENGVIYNGSLHMLIRRVRGSAQAGDVVNILKETGAVRSVSHGHWELCRRHVFEDDYGNPIEVRPVPGHGDRPIRVVQDQLRNLAGRVAKLEDTVEKLVAILIQNVTVNPEDLVEEVSTNGTEDSSSDEELERDVDGGDID